MSVRHAARQWIARLESLVQRGMKAPPPRPVSLTQILLAESVLP
jgi:hypothetical protein